MDQQKPLQQLSNNHFARLGLKATEGLHGVGQSLTHQPTTVLLTSQVFRGGGDTYSNLTLKFADWRILQIVLTSFLIVSGYLAQKLMDSHKGLSLGDLSTTDSSLG